ncbi:MAG: CBS domain-containing protein [Gemmatimonadota bacterium]
MAAYTSGRRLHELKVAEIMTEDVATIGPQESLRDAEKAMRARGVRRLPVIDEERRVIGVLSCNDICRWVDDVGSNGARHHDATHLGRTLATIGKPRGPAAVGSLASNAPTALEPAAPLEAPTVRQRDADIQGTRVIRVILRTDCHTPHFRAR